MGRRKTRRWWFAPLLGLLAVGGDTTSGQGPAKPATARWVAPTSLYDPRLEPLRRAAATWELRSGPDRRVVDQVCLVPDLPTFFEAIGSWDSGHYFPILIDDVESSFRFIRAFKPARIVRYPKSAPATAGGQVWDRAVAAVGSSWVADGKPASVSIPKELGPTPPGVVISSADAPMLAGAVALAAGRFQPLLRLDTPRRFADVLAAAEARSFGSDVTELIRRRVPVLDRLGDDCDFVTLAGDYPYRYRDEKGDLDAVDDRVGRSIGSDQRWAYVGRILGNAQESVYRAMCSLFLQPESALLFNGYDEGAPPWSEYSMRDAALRLSGALPTSQVSGEKAANIEGWHETFDPLNRFGLVLINSHGSPTVFNIRGGPASAVDVPRTIPSAVLMIHSFSAADPTDPSTIAGRWLANGAFAFFGSMNEPYLNSFRSPRLVADLIVDRLPLVAAVRATLAEPFGQPWRLVFLGDPLYRLEPRANPSSAPRLARWEPVERWPRYQDGPRPTDGPDVDLFAWALRSALGRLQGPDDDPNSTDDIVEAVQAIRRDRLPAAYRSMYDALLVEVLIRAKKRVSLTARIAAIPEPERSPMLRRAYENLLAVDLNLAIGRADSLKAQAVWSDLMKADAPREFKEQSTARVGRLADDPRRRRDWGQLLRSTARDRPKPPDLEIIEAESKRVEEAMKSDR